MGSRQLLGSLALALALVPTGRVVADPATFHLVMINEVYSNFDGTKQFVELIAVAAGQTQMQAARVNAHDPTGSITTLVYDFTTTFNWGNMDVMLLATQGVADELGFAPDFIIPDAAITIADGRVIFAQDPNFTIDALAYGDYTGNMSGFGTPAPGLPTNGVMSLHRTRYSFIGQDNSQDFTIAVNTPTNRAGQTGTLGQDPLPPVLDPIGPKSVDEGALLSFLVTATDPNGTSPSLSAEDLPAGAAFNDNGDGSGSFDWTPSFLQGGSVYDVRFIASDADSADTEVVAITVNEVTDPPVARDTIYLGIEDLPLSQQLLATDPDLDPLTFAITGGPYHGAITAFDAISGAFTYEPDPDYFGLDSLLFEAFDGAATSNEAIVHLDIEGVNDPPVAQNALHSTTKNTPVAIGVMPVTDVDDVSWTIAHTSGPFHGAVSDFNPATGSFTYTPDPDFVGLDSIFYQADDGQDFSNVALVRITVIEGCDCPFQADMDASTTITSVDLTLLINVVFFGGTDVQDGSCPRSRSDMNADGVTNAVDLTHLINHVFFGGPPATDPCL